MEGSGVSSIKKLYQWNLKLVKFYVRTKESKNERKKPERKDGRKEGRNEGRKERNNTVERKKEENEDVTKLDFHLVTLVQFRAILLLL